MGRIILISGYARSGKDEAARVIMGMYKGVHLSFAREAKLQFFNMYGIEVTEENKDKPVGMNRYGLDPRKTIRECLIIFAEAAKRDINPTVWAEKVKICEDSVNVISDWRFGYEHDCLAMKYRHELVYTIRISNSRAHPCGDVDKQLDSWEGFDIIVKNEGSLEEYRRDVWRAVTDMIGIKTR